MEIRDAQQGAVSFDWREVGQRLTFAWSLRGLRVSMEPLEARATA